jgi:hypothetical protein
MSPPEEKEGDSDATRVSGFKARVSFGEVSSRRILVAHPAGHGSVGL